MLADVHVCLAYDTITCDKNLPLTAALLQLVAQGNTRFIAWCQECGTVASPQAHAYPWSLLNTPWPGVRYVAANPSIQESLVDTLGLSKQEVRLIPAGVETEHFLIWEPVTYYLAERIDLLAAYPVLICPTPIKPGRGIEFAIQTLAALRNDLSEARLLVVNTPLAQTQVNQPYLVSLRALCEQMGLSQHIHFLHKGDQHGPPVELSRAVLSDLYRLSDVLLVPDTCPPSSGVPLLEAGLARLPIFAADPFPILEASDQMVHHFAADEPQQLAKRIVAYLEGAALPKVRRQVLKQYTWLTILEKHLAPLIEEASR